MQTQSASGNPLQSNIFDKVNGAFFYANGTNFLGKLNRRLGVNLGAGTIESHLDTIYSYTSANPSADIFNTDNRSVRNAIRHLGSVGISSKDDLIAVMSAPYFSGKYSRSSGQQSNDKLIEAISAWSTQASGMAHTSDVSGLANIPGAKVFAQGTATMYAMGTRVAGRILREFTDVAVDAVKAEKGANYEVTAGDVLRHHGLPVSYVIANMLPIAATALAFGALQNAFNQPFRDPEDENEMYDGSLESTAQYTFNQYGTIGAYQKGFDISVAFASMINEAGEFDLEYFEDQPNYKKDAVGQLLGIPVSTVRKLSYSLQGGEVETLLPAVYQLRQSTKKWLGGNIEPELQDYFDFLADASSDTPAGRVPQSIIGMGVQSHEYLISNMGNFDEEQVNSVVESEDPPRFNPEFTPTDNTGGFVTETGVAVDEVAAP
ncbi:hypothetical protein JCM19239_5308 [Vibrio variabilis]|uniref:Uncharacterized protein n=1 Tax=Vibrio variabilis TaxID=990271 RepID=A0ABQ0JNR2_9VIBR|nr:hypothetical protein JCM19239_5308 [Vibrio variabilis]